MSFWEDKLSGKNPAPVIPSRTLFNMHNPVGSIQQHSIPQSYQPGIRLKQGGSCPYCGSDKYMPHGNYAIACAECGYHPRFEQSGHGERSLKTAPGEAQAARQSGDFQTMQSAIATLNVGGGDHIGNI